MDFDVEGATLRTNYKSEPRFSDFSAHFHRKIYLLWKKNKLNQNIFWICFFNLSLLKRSEGVCKNTIINVSCLFLFVTYIKFNF